MLADVYTPVGIYMRLRDSFRDTILLESSDNHRPENSYSFICVNAIAGIEVISDTHVEYRLPGDKPRQIQLGQTETIPGVLNNFLNNFSCTSSETEARFAQGLYGYTSYNIVKAIDGVEAKGSKPEAASLLRYRLYQYVIAINHYKDEMVICENKLHGVDSEFALLMSLVKHKDVPMFPFKALGSEESFDSAEQYMYAVQKGIEHCHLGDVFQVVLSRGFMQPFSGDEFNVYRALRNINPSPYLFYFDYGSYKIFGSSPEAQVVIHNGKATVYPIAGTFRRTGQASADHQLAEKLLQDPKENAEHTMLVDLARNDLSIHCKNVRVTRFKEIQFYSHVIHMVSEVTGEMKEGCNAFDLLFSTFPAGTLSGAPKYRAMQLIDELEATGRGYYGGAIGFLGFNGDCNHAIMIRSFMSMHNRLMYRAGAGVVASSVPENELAEVNNKIGALRRAIENAGKLSK